MAASVDSNGMLTLREAHLRRQEAAPSDQSLIARTVLTLASRRIRVIVVCDMIWRSSKR
jgi:hypothetical protein